MSGKLVPTIYFYVISAGAIVLMVIGVFNIVNLFVNSTQYDEYPLRYNAISSCENYFTGRDYGEPMPMTKVQVAPMLGYEATPSAEEIAHNKELCFKNEEADRKQHLVDDIKNAVTFSLVGLVLFLIHFPLARRQTNNV